MKLFTLEEANALLPTARRIAEDIVRLHERLAAFSDRARRATEGAELGGGFMPGGEKYIGVLMRLGERTGELETLGVQLKDYERGLIDFPSLREGRVVLLCWQVGEGSRIEWWHETDAGFAGRQRL